MVTLHWLVDTWNGPCVYKARTIIIKLALCIYKDKTVHCECDQLPQCCKGEDVYCAIILQELVELLHVGNVVSVCEKCTTIYCYSQ